MQKLVFIKLGGSVITDKSRSFVAKEKIIRRLGREILAAQKKYKGKLILAHGSGSFGHTVASKYQTHKGLINKKSVEGFVRTSDAAVQINKIVMENLIKAGLFVKSFAPSSFIFAKKSKVKKVLIEPIKQALNLNAIPVIYGDVILDSRMGFCIFSAEKTIQVLVGALYGQYKIEKIVYCVDTNGVYDGKGKTIPLITPRNLDKVKAGIGGSKSTDVTGGMLHKVEESMKLVKKHKTEIFLINGRRRGDLKRMFFNKKVEGTKIID